MQPDYPTLPYLLITLRQCCRLRQSVFRFAQKKGYGLVPVLTFFLISFKFHSYSNRRFFASMPLGVRVVGPFLKMSRFVYTFFRYTEEEYQKILNIPCAFHVIAKEKSQIGNPHLQGYIEFNFPISYPAFKKMMGRGCHIEKAKKGRVSNTLYCTKGGDFKILTHP